MDSEPHRTLTKSKNEQKKTINNIPDAGSICESTGIRRDSIDIDSINRFIIESQFRFILPCSILLWTVFLLIR